MIEEYNSEFARDLKKLEIAKEKNSINLKEENTMSYDLSFWKCKNSVSESNEYIYTELSNENYLDYLEELPVEEINKDFNREFRSWKGEEEQFFEKGEEAFKLMITKQFVRADCYGVSEDNMNKIIDIMLKYDCPLYDAAINVRFDG